MTLKTGNVEVAQVKKEELEELQRHDRKVREVCVTRREKGGKKYGNIS